MPKNGITRRDFVKKAAYIAPAIVTLKAAPSFAKTGSLKPKDPKGPKDPKDSKDSKDSKASKAPKV